VILSLAFLLALVYDCTCILLLAMRDVFLTICVLGFNFFASCTDPANEVELFVPLSSESSGIDFINSLEYSEQLNPYTFKNFYNGGGVAIGDINNDGLADIFFLWEHGLQ